MSRRRKCIEILCFAALTILLTLITLPPSAYSQEGPGQTWLSGVVEIPLSEQLKALLIDDSRYNEGGLYYQGSEMTLLQRMSRKADLEAGYKNVYKINSGQWKNENDYYAGVILIGKLGSLDLSDRNRFEICTFAYDSPTYLRYRNKLALAIPGKISPYLADEIFYNLGGDHPGLNRNRIFLGVKGDLGRSVNLDLYVMRQTDAKFLDEGETKERFNAIGGTLTIRF